MKTSIKILSWCLTIAGLVAAPTVASAYQPLPVIARGPPSAAPRPIVVPLYLLPPPRTTPDHGPNPSARNVFRR